jgi:hypothetical protein
MDLCLDGVMSERLVQFGTQEYARTRNLCAVQNYSAFLFGVCKKSDATSLK